MKKTICRALLCLLLAACLLPLTARTAHADKIYDEIVNYQVDVTPNTEDGSLAIQVTDTVKGFSRFTQKYIRFRYLYA